MVVCEVRSDKTILIAPASPLVTIASASRVTLEPTLHPLNSSSCSSKAYSLTQAHVSAPLTSKTSTLIPQCLTLNISTWKSQTFQQNSLRNTNLKVVSVTVGFTSKFAGLLWPSPGRHSCQQSPPIPPSCWRILQSRIHPRPLAPQMASHPILSYHWWLWSWVCWAWTLQPSLRCS